MPQNLSNSPAPLWRPPGPSRSSRNIAIHERCKASCRPSIVGGAEPREIRCESGLEKKAGYFLLTHPQVVDLQEQPRAIAYRDAAGIERKHTFDFLATLQDGRKLAIPVKPKSIAERKRLREICTLMAGQIAKTFADGILPITDADLPRDVVHNAMVLHHSRRGADPDHDAVIGRLVAEAGDGTVGGLVAASGLGGAGFRAVMRLIARGLIRLVGHARIDHGTAVTWSGTANGEVE